MNCCKLFASIRMFALPLILAMTVTACVKPSPRDVNPNAASDDANQPAATFFAGDVSGSAVVSKNFDGFSIPSQKLFTFKTCVQDKRTREPIKGHKFDVLGAKNLTIANDGRSDESGCVNWSEEIDYNGASDSRYIPLKRTLAARGMHTGSRNFNICINPWDNSDVVRDCGRRPVPAEQLAKPDEVGNYLKGMNEKGEVNKRHLWVNDLRLNSVHNPGGGGVGMIDFSVAMSPKVFRRNVRGEQEPLVLQGGKFNLQFWIVAKTGNGPDKNQCVVIGKTPMSADTEMITGSLQKEMKMQIRYLSTYGQLELVGIVQPRKTSGLEPFQGLWTLGDHTGLLGMKFAFQRGQTYEGEVGSFDAKKYVSNCIDVADGALLERTPIAASAGVPTFGPSKDGSLTIAPAGNGNVKVTLKDESVVTAKDGSQVLVDGKPVIAYNTHLVDGKPVPISATVPADLMVDECIDGRDIPRLFPKDAIAQHFRGGPDFLSCVNKNLPSGITRLEPFEFSPAVARVEPIDDPVNTETTNERTIKYQVTVTVTNPLAQGAPLRDIMFDIERADGTVAKDIRTNNRGELIFTDKVHHSYFAPERYILKVVQIRHSSGFTKRLAIVFNPWDNNGFQFARDIRGMTKLSVARVNLIPRPKSELLLTQFQWGTQVFRYEVDDFLNLKIFKTFNLTLNPRVLRYSSLADGRNKDEPLRAGIYLMKIAIQKDYKPLDGQPLEYITAVSKLVRVRNGVINEPVEMMFRDFRVLKLRSNLMIELATIDESKMTPEQRKHASFNGPLDSLIEPNSGLAARTFIGPVVPYSNGFSASMRPADDLSENVCVTIDCDELKKNQEVQIEKELTDDIKLAEKKDKDEKKTIYAAKARRALELYKAQLILDRQFAKDKQVALLAREKYVGSIKHLTGKTVSDMVERMYEIEHDFRTKVTNNSRLIRFLKEANLEYAAAKNEPAILAQDEDLKENNQVLAPGRSFRDFVNRMNRVKAEDSFPSGGLERYVEAYRGLVSKKPVVSPEDVKSVLFGTKPMTRDIAARLCVVFVEDMILQRHADLEKTLPFTDYVAARARRLSLNADCLRNVLQRGVNPSDGGEPVIVRENKLRVFKVVESERRAGNLMSVNRGANTSWGSGTSESFSYGWSPSKSLEGVLKLAGLGLAEKVLDTFGASVSITRSDSKSMGNGSSLTASQSLSVEIREMRLNISQYERCTTLRLSQDFVETNFSNLRQSLSNNLNLKQKMDRMGRGLFLCEGFIDTKPLPDNVDERYYQFSQFMGEEVMNDPTSLENHPYLIETIRGHSDFARFMRIIEGVPTSISSIREDINVGELPMTSLKAAFKTAIPKFPGIYTIEPDQIRLAPVIHECFVPTKREPNRQDKNGNPIPHCESKAAVTPR